MYKDNFYLSIAQLLVHCPIAGNLWELALSFLSLHWVIPNSVRHQLFAWEVFWGEAGSSIKFFEPFPMISFGCCVGKEIE